MRVAVIGNSHVAALQQAPATPEHLDVTFFAAPRRGILTLTPAGDRLESTEPEVRQALHLTSGGAEHVAVAGFDAFVVVGVTSVASVALAWSPHRTLADAAGRDVPLISEPCFRDTLRGLITAGGLLRLATRLRGLTGAPIVLVPGPLPTPGFGEHVPVVGAIWEREPQFVAHIGAHFVEALSEHDLPVVAQPAATLHDDLYTDPRFARDGLWLLREGTFVNDGVHLNGDYGQRLWAEIARTLAQARRQ